MKNVIRAARLAVLLAAVLAMPSAAQAAVKFFGSMTASPASTNITPGVGTTVSSLISLASNGSGSTGYKGDATFTLSISPPEATITLNITNNPVNLPAVSSSTNAMLIVTTTGATPSNTYVITIVANTNPPTPAQAMPTNCTFTITMGTAAPFNPVKVWTNGGVNGNWSTAGNWTPSGAPGSSNDVKFLDPGAVGTPGSVNNTVDSTTTVGSVTYGQTNNSHTTLISPGLTLTVSGTNGLTAGTGTDNGDLFVTVNTIKATNATLVVSNNSAAITVSQSHVTTGTTVAQSQATLDASAVDTFNANISRLLVGADVNIKGASGVLNLGKTNRIILTAGSTAPQIDVGDNSQSQGSPAIPSILALGQTNAIFADSISVGKGKTDGSGSTIVFNSSFANPVAYFRGTNGNSSRVGSWNIGDAFGSRNNFPNDCRGSNDFSLGTINALVSTMFVGKGASTANGAGANTTGTGTLVLGAGTMDVDTMEVGYAQTATGSGTVYANGGSLVVNTNLELGHGAGSSGMISASSATLTANNGISAGGGSATLILTSSTLNATNAGATVGTGASPLTTLAVTNSTLKVAAQNLNPAVTVSTLSVGGANTLSFSVIPLIVTLPAQYSVVKYSALDGDFSALALGTLPSASPAYQGYLSNNVGNSSIDLVITNGPVVYPLIWVGNVNGNWDINSTANWKSNGIASKYAQGYLVVNFDDSLTGTNGVNLTTTLTPGSVTVNNSLSNYTFVGSGKLSGAMSLVKNGTAALTLAESGGDDFSGGVSVLGGTLQVGNGGTSGTLPAGGKVSVDTSASLVFNRSDNLTVSSVISGLGTISQNGGSVVSLTGSNTAFAGTFVAATGTLQAGTVASLGSAASSVNVSNAATFDANGQAFNNNQPVYAVGAGVGSGGAIVNNGTNQTRVLRNVTLSGDTTFGGSGDWDIHSSANGTSDAALNGSTGTYKLTKANTNTVTIFGVQVDSNLGDIDILAGTVSFERNTTSMGDFTKTVTVFTNATLQLQNASNIWNKIVVLKNGSTFRGINLDEFAGPVTLQGGSATLLAGNNAQLILDNVVDGAGGLTKSGSGGVTLQSANTYTGPTLVSAGTLALGMSGSITSSTNITLAVGATLDAGARSDQTVSIGAGRTLQGSGLLIGNATLATGSTLSVGIPGTNSLGTLTITNALSLQAGSTTLMEIGKSGTNILNDQVVATNITYGGTLTVTGVGGAFAPGDTFRLFAAGTYGGSFSATNLPVGTTWNTSQLGVNGTISVISVAPPQFTGRFPTNGGFQLSFSGPAGNSYRVWATTNISAAPVTSTWTLLASNGVFGTSGTAVFLDTSSSNYPARYYTVTVP